MRIYPLTQLTSVVFGQANAAGTIPELKQALTGLRTVAQHWQEHKSQVYTNTIARMIVELEMSLGRAVAAQDVADAALAHKMRIALERSPAEQIKRLHPKKTTEAAKKRPQAFGQCLVTKINGRHELRSLQGEVLLAEALTHNELCDLKWFAQTHFAPINWTGYQPRGQYGSKSAKIVTA